MDEVGFSIVGLGMGRSRARLIAQTEGARLVSVIDLQQELAEEVAGELECKWSTQMDEALADKDVDVMVIMTPSGLHADLSIPCLNAGKHTIVTKPMDITVDRCDAILAAQRASGKLLAIDYQRRFEEGYSKAKFAVDHGLFGKMLMGEARLKWYRGQDYFDKGGWRGTWKMDGGGSLANQTIHEIDLLRWLMGKPKSVVGKIGVLNHDIETEDVGMAMIEFENGAMGTILGTTTFTGTNYEGLEIHGVEGAMVNTGTEPQWTFAEGMEERIDQLQPHTPFGNTFENMVAALRDNAPLVCDGHEGRESVELVNAIYESARNGSKVVQFN